MYTPDNTREEVGINFAHAGGPLDARGYLEFLLTDKFPGLQVLASVDGNSWENVEA